MFFFSQLIPKIFAREVGFKIFMGVIKCNLMIHLPQSGAAALPKRRGNPMNIAGVRYLGLGGRRDTALGRERNAAERKRHGISIANLCR